MKCEVFLVLLSILALFSLGSSRFYSFRRDFLVRVNFKNYSNLNEIRKISFVNKVGYRDSLDLLESNDNKTTGVFLISRHIINEARRFFKRQGFSFEKLQNDLDKKIKFEKRINRKSYFQSVFQRSGRVKPHYYMRYDEIRTWLRNKEKLSTFMKLEVLGRTVENRDIMLAKISKDESKPILWVDAGIHAREWISPSTGIFVIDKLLENSDRSAMLLQNYQVYVLPLINPDGYEHTHLINRMWRKNRVPTSIPECMGTDLNRNYPYHWGESGASPDPCSRIYQGPSAESEKETKAVIGKLTEIKSNIKLFITLHSFGQYIMSPYGYSRYRYSRQHYKLLKMGDSISAYLRETYGRTYQVGTAANLLYEASGASDDYAAGELRIAYSYAIELPDRGRYGFLLPPTYIKSVGNQFWDTLYKFTEEMAD